jgi:glutamate 5-kinase
MRATLNELLRLGALPVVNENDTVSVDELKLGDNDNLAATVAALVDADALFIATDIDGLYSADPRTWPTHGRCTMPELSDGAGDGRRRRLALAPAACAPSWRRRRRRVASASRPICSTAAALMVRAGTGPPVRYPHPCRTQPRGRPQALAAARAAGRRRDRRRCRCGTGDAREGRLAAARRHHRCGGHSAAATWCRCAGTRRRAASAWPRRQPVRGRRRAPHRGHHSRDIQAVLGYNYGGSVVHRDDLVLP